MRTSTVALASGLAATATAAETIHGVWLSPATETGQPSTTEPNNVPRRSTMFPIRFLLPQPLPLPRLPPANLGHQRRTIHPQPDLRHSTRHGHSPQHRHRLSPRPLPPLILRGNHNPQQRHLRSPSPLSRTINTSPCTAFPPPVPIPSG